MRLPTDAPAVPLRLAVLLGLLLAPATGGVARAAAPVVPAQAAGAEAAAADPAGVAPDVIHGDVIEEDVAKGAAEGLDEPGSPAWVSRVENVSYSYAQVLRVDPVAEDVAWRERERQCPGDAPAAPPPAPVAAPARAVEPVEPVAPPREGRIASLFGSLVDGLLGRDAVVVREEPAPVEPLEPVAPAPAPAAPAADAPAEGFADVGADVEAADPGADPAEADAPDADGCIWVDVDRVETKVVAYDVEYRYRGDIYVSRMRHDPGARLRIRVAVSPADEAR